MTVLGIDPGNKLTGWGVVEMQGPTSFHHLGHGVLRPPARTDGDSHTHALWLATATQELVREYQPSRIGVEDSFVGANMRTSSSIAEARGALLAGLGSCPDSLSYLTSPATIKRTVCGNGNASKKDVILAVQQLLNLPEAPLSDAADALAVAIYTTLDSVQLSVPVRKRGRTRGSSRYPGW